MAGPDVDVDLLESRRRYVDALGRGDRLQATDVALGLTGRGMPAGTVLTGLVGAGQVEVGLAWQDGRWTVAQEHRASAVAESVLHEVAREAAATGRAAAGRGRVAVASAEGEWHVLPGRLVSEVLRLNGFDAQFLGPSVPAAELARFLGSGPAGVVAVTCSMPSSLVGAWRTIRALRGVGRTIVCGGRGFGPGGSWGLALGADLAADDIDTGLALFDDALARPAGVCRPDVVRPAAAAEIALASRELHNVVAAATHLAVARWAHPAGDRAWVRDVRGMLALTVRAILAAALVGDDRIVVDHVRWSEALLAARGQPVGLAAEALSVLVTAMPADLPRCVASARAGLAASSRPSRRPASRGSARG